MFLECLHYNEVKHLQMVNYLSAIKTTFLANYLSAIKTTFLANYWSAIKTTFLANYLSAIKTTFLANYLSAIKTTFLANYLSAIKTTFLLHGLDVACFADARLKYYEKSIQIHAPLSVKLKKIIDIPLLKDIVDQCDYTYMGQISKVFIY